MSVRTCFILSALSVGISLAGSTQEAKALPSDRMLVTSIATGEVLYDASIPEPAPGESEGQLRFYGTAQTFNGNLAIRSAVTLTEPAGAPAGENPIVIPGTDVVVGASVILSVVPPVISDYWFFELFFQPVGYPTFELYPSAPRLEKSGSLQDITSLLHTDQIGWRVQVQSAPVPEPDTGLLVMTGILGLAVWRRRV